MAHIFKITKDPLVLTIKNSKVVEGKFGNQIWLSVVDTDGLEGTCYVPLGIQRQFAFGGALSEGDEVQHEGESLPQLTDTSWSFERVFKDGKQYINAHPVSGVMQAAIKHLDLERDKDENEFAQSLGMKSTIVAPVPTPQRKQRESANDRIDRALNHVMTKYAPQFAEMDQALVKNICAFTALFAIAYEKEG